ncbi:MAG TPA: hypothetical protein VKU60_07055, partial [Chloroflexota bacterium]|nr:hypothetical protein [Chloroflexota bacterium]
TDRDIEPVTASDDRPGLLKLDLLNHDDDNWWCRWKGGRNARELQEQLRSAFFGELLPEMGSEEAYRLRDQLRPAIAASYAFASQDSTEASALSSIDCAPKLLTERTLQWVRHPGLLGGRDGQAEALGLAVRSTRYGCDSDGQHGVYSKAAWQELHERFPQSEWARKTRYWFNCRNGDTCAVEDDP